MNKAVLKPGVAPPYPRYAGVRGTHLPAISDVIGIDPGSHTTGVCLLRPNAGGRLLFVTGAVLDASGDEFEAGYLDSLSQQVARVSTLSNLMSGWLADKKLGYTLWCYEDDQNTVRGVTTALQKTLGALLVQAGGYPVVQIDPVSAKAAWGGVKYQRAEAKRAVLQWFRAEFGGQPDCPNLGEKDDHIADAAAVAIAGYQRYLLAQRTGEQLNLFDRGRRGIKLNMGRGRK